MVQTTEHTIFDKWKMTGELLTFLLKQEGLTSLADAGGPQAVREMLPEEYRDHFDIVQPGLIDTLLKPKNRLMGTVFAAAVAGMGTMSKASLDSGRIVCESYVGSAPIFAALDLMGMGWIGTGGFCSALYVDGVEEGIDRIEAEGLPDHLCSTQKGGAGYLLSGAIPKPDVLIKTATPCDPSNAVYEWAAHKFDIPFIVVEIPYYHDERGLKYMVREFEGMIEQLEKITGKTLDEARVRRAVNTGNEMLDYVLKIQELRNLSPCPDTSWHRIFDFFYANAFGNPGALTYFELLHQEVKGRADRGEGVIPPDKKERRFVWGSTGEAYDLSLFDWLEEEHGVTCGPDILTYQTPDTRPVDPSSMKTMIEGLAWRMMDTPMVRQSIGFSDLWIDDMIQAVKDFRADALVLGGHMACKHFWALNKLLSDRVREETGIPTLRFELDLYDKRFTPPAELRRIMSEFIMTL